MFCFFVDLLTVQLFSLNLQTNESEEFSAKMTTTHSAGEWNFIVICKLELCEFVESSWVLHCPARLLVSSLFVWLCATSSHSVLMQTLRSNTQRCSKPHPSFSHTNYNYVIRFTNKQHTHSHTTSLGLAVILSKLWGDEKTFNLVIINLESIKVSCNHLFSCKCLSNKDIRWERDEGDTMSTLVCVLQRTKQEKEIVPNERQKVPLSLSGDLKLVKSMSEIQAHKLDMELFHSHDWTPDIYPQSLRVMEPVCPSCAVTLWPPSSHPAYHCCIRGRQISR